MANDRVQAAADKMPADLPEADGVPCEAQRSDLSGHCALSHLHAAFTAPRFRHLEWFYNPVRIEQMLFGGAPLAREGMIRPYWARPGLGLEFKRHDAQRYVV
jgi:hypothetical protein